METDINTYVLSSDDLICDNHFNEEGELIEGVKEQVLDEEDVNFLEDLIEELPKIDKCYVAESEELENILFRLVRAYFQVRFSDGSACWRLFRATHWLQSGQTACR